MEKLNIENLEGILPVKIWDPNSDPIEPNCDLFRELESAALSMQKFLTNSLSLKLSGIQKPTTSQEISKFEKTINQIYEQLKLYPSEDIKNRISNEIRSCHHSTVAASIRRRGDYWFDLKKVYYDALWEALCQMLWECFNQTSWIEEQNLKWTQALLYHLYDCVQQASFKSLSWMVIFNDHRLWDELQSEWGKRPKPAENYRDRVARRFTQKIGTFHEALQEYEDILNAWREGVLNMWKLSTPIGPPKSGPLSALLPYLIKK
jgi:predicted DNA-binding protein YlxM (UPF0122 family)